MAWHGMAWHGMAWLTSPMFPLFRLPVLKRRFLWHGLRQRAYGSRQRWRWVSLVPWWPHSIEGKGKHMFEDLLCVLEFLGCYTHVCFSLRRWASVSKTKGVYRTQPVQSWSLFCHLCSRNLNRRLEQFAVSSFIHISSHHDCSMLALSQCQSLAFACVSPFLDCPYRLPQSILSAQDSTTLLMSCWATRLDETPLGNFGGVCQ